MFSLLAPAKLNLYLRVLGRRRDGYHEIETLFERIDLFDELTFELYPEKLFLSCTDPGLSCSEDNLIFKAARLLQSATHVSQGAKIHLKKCIPIAAGLGGGSSDAAATLKGLNQLWKLGLTQVQLIELAGRLGSDVPFFLLEKPFAIGRGRGDHCRALATSVCLAHLLVSPQVEVSTKDVYQTTDFNLTASKPSLNIVAHALHNGSLGELAKGLWNDLEPEAIRRCPLITVIHSSLQALGCQGVLVSGSGPSVYGLCRDLPHAQDVAVQMRKQEKLTSCLTKVVQSAITFA